MALPCQVLISALGLALAAPPQVLEVPGGYPRATLLSNGTLVLVTGQFPRCGIYATEDMSSWRFLPGPDFQAGAGDQLANCFLGEGPDGGLLMGVRHHDNCSSGVCQVYRIQVVRSEDSGHTWGAPVNVYANADYLHAAWEPVFYQSQDRQTVRVAYSLERPPSWTPPACAPATNFGGGDLGPSFTASRDLCQAHCQGDQRCEAWSFRAHDGQCWLKGPDHSQEADANVESGAKLCDLGAGTLTAALEPREQDLVVHESADGGRSWGPARLLSRRDSSRDGMPSITRQGDGCLICVFEATDSGVFKSNSVRSCDDGKTWIRQAVSTQSQATTGHAPTVAVLHDGRAAVASYTESNDVQIQFSKAPLMATDQILWSEPRPLVTGLSRPSWPELFVDASGRLWLAYENEGSKVVGPLNLGERLLVV